jgi:DNA-binding beta-propeller fold protein YncE
VQAFTRDGRLVRVLAGRLNAPRAVAVDTAGNVFIADSGNNRVVEYAWWGGFIREFGVGALENPRRVAVDRAGNLLVSDTGISGSPGSTTEPVRCSGRSPRR